MILTGTCLRYTALLTAKGVDIVSPDLACSGNTTEWATPIPLSLQPSVVCHSFWLSVSGCKDAAKGQLLKELMQTPYFRIVVVQDEQTVELCGALKVHQI